MASWLEELKVLTEERLHSIVGNKKIGQQQKTLRILREEEQSLLEKKKNLLKKRQTQMVKVTANGQIISQRQIEKQKVLQYLLHLQYLIRQKNDSFYLEEHVEHRQAVVENNRIVDDQIVLTESCLQTNEQYNKGIQFRDIIDHSKIRQSYHYDRRKAVQYAERWWNSYNPKYKKFENDCTNFISQCLHEGGIPMTGFGNRNKGWWYNGISWSYSWAVAHSFRWYLSGAKQGIRAQEVSEASDLQLGDVICYDFEGDGRWNHNTIVVAKDANNQPLVNAHTYNSRMRYWTYEDSTAYTPNIKYKFFHILDAN